MITIEVWDEKDREFQGMPALTVDGDTLGEAMVKLNDIVLEHLLKPVPF